MVQIPGWSLKTQGVMFHVSFAICKNDICTND
jgi:hypothetical protein